MQYKVIALSALVAVVSAQEQSPDVASLLAVLQTALPSSLIQAAYTNSASVVSEIQSEFLAGSTPTWFSALPSDIQTYVMPTGTQEAISIASELSQSLASITTMSSLPAQQTNSSSSTYAVGNTTAVASAQSSILSGASAANSSIISNINSSAMTNTMSNTMSSGMTTTTGGSGGSQTTGGASGSNSDSSSTSSDSGAMPTAVFGMGVAGAVGMVGLLAL